ncbi:hypothetical protein EDD15DRAFT_2359127 [Pisolithus albus]|nr:hypothetical protein EDD15DRAFT_2359127 [Pisolithus albus]
MITWASNGSTPIEQETFGIESDVKIQNPRMNTGSGKLPQLAHPSCIAAMPTPSLPVEIERMIFVLCAQHKNRCAYLAVARRVRVWLALDFRYDEQTYLIDYRLEPIVYRVVHLPSNRVAKKFLQSIGSRPEFAEKTVKVLFFGAAVAIEMAGEILGICHGIEDLTLRVPCHLIGKNPVLEPMNALQRLRALSIDLASIFNNRIIYLPNIDTLHRVTHLHISNAWASWQGGSQTIGVEGLEQITHLSFHFSTLRTEVSMLKGVLKRDNLVAMVLWQKWSMTDDQVREWLKSHDLADRRIVILNGADFFSAMQGGGFWNYVECLVDWHRKNDGESP